MQRHWAYLLLLLALMMKRVMNAVVKFVMTVHGNLLGEMMLNYVRSGMTTTTLWTAIIVPATTVDLVLKSKTPKHT